MSIALLDIINNISLAGWIVGLGGLIAATLSGVIFWQDTKNRSNKFFFLFGIINAVWGLVYAYFEGSFGTSDINTGIVALYSSAAIVPVFLFLFFYVFAVDKTILSIKKLSFFFAPYFVIEGILLVKPDFIVGYREAVGLVPSKIVFGSGFAIYAIYIIAFLVIAIIFLVKKHRESAGIFKIAIQEILTATATTCTAAVTMSLFSPFFGGDHDLFWIGHISVILLIFAIAFIIIKYNFWNIKIIATELFISIIILVLVAELFTATSLTDLMIKVSITILVLFSSSFLVGSVKREIQSKEKITSLLQDLEIASRRLKILDKKKSEFLSIASHHLRDPLTAIRGYASMLSDGSFGDLPVGVREAIQKIFESSGHLITMISDFMDISRIESGDMNYTFSDVDMKKLVLAVADGMKQNADHAHLSLSVTIDEGRSSDEQFITVGDAGKLRQVISNLVDNSIKYTPQGEVSLLLCKSPDKKKILFSLSDTGIGMSESTKEKIFEKFSRAEGVNRVYTEGTGLGLYVAKEIVRKHEGNIWADSRGEGQGSTFFVELDAKG